MTEVQNPLAEIDLIFREECLQFLDVLLEGAASLALGKADPNTLSTMRRAVHSAKGGAGALDYPDLHRFAHALEDVLDAVRAGDIDPVGEPRRIILNAVNVLAAHIGTVTDQRPVPDDADALLALRALIKRTDAAGEQDAFGFEPMPVDLTDLDEIDDSHLPWRIQFMPAAADLDNGREPIRLLRELALIGATAFDPYLADLPPIEDLAPREAYVGWTISVPATVARTAIEDCLDFVSPQALVTIKRDHTASIATVADRPKA